MRINTNIAAFNAQRNLSHTQNQLTSSLEKLSSGFRINRAADDAAGLVNSENLRAQIGGLGQAQSNAQDAISMIQTAEGAQTEVHASLQRIRDLVVDTGNEGANDDAVVEANQQEINQLIDELDRVAQQTQYGTQTILDGSFDGVIESTGEIDGGANIADVDDAFVQLSSNTSNLGELDGTRITTADGESGTVDLGAAINAVSDGDTTISLTVSGGLDASDSGVQNAVNDALQSALDDMTVTDGDGNEASLGDLVNIGSTLGSTDSNTATVSLDGTATSNGVDLTSDTVTIDVGGGDDLTFQVGANAGQTVDLTIDSVASEDLASNQANDALNTSFEGVASLRDAFTESNDLSASVDQALDLLDQAIGDVSNNRGELGALQNRMEATVRNLGVAEENLQAAESRIRDTDMAGEMVEFTRHQILQQAGTSMLAQANQLPQSVLSLLQ